MQIVAGADAAAPRTAASRAPRAGEIRGGGDLHVARRRPRRRARGSPACSASAASSVASTPARPSATASREHSAAEGLRRLRQEDRLARQRLGITDAAAVATRLTVSVTATATIAAPCAAAASMDREISPRVTNGRAASWTSTMSDARRTRVERVGDRVLPPRAARDDPMRPPAVADPGRRRLGHESAGSATMTSVTRVADERVHAVLRGSMRPPISSSCLGTRGAEPAAGAARRDDRGHVHGRESGSEVKRSLYGDHRADSASTLTASARSLDPGDCIAAHARSSDARLHVLDDRDACTPARRRSARAR